MRSRLPVNIEHVVPQTRIKAITWASGDLHNLWPAILEVNAARQHWRLVTDIPGERGFFKDRREPELAACDFELQAVEGGAVVEPAPATRGPLGRAMLHMLLAYPSIKSAAGEIDHFLAWHTASPVSAEEKQRNDAIARVMGTRNVFVDFPEAGATIVQACQPNTRSGRRKAVNSAPR